MFQTKLCFPVLKTWGRGGGVIIKIPPLFILYSNYAVKLYKTSWTYSQIFVFTPKKTYNSASAKNIIKFSDSEDFRNDIFTSIIQIQGEFNNKKGQCDVTLNLNYSELLQRALTYEYIDDQGEGYYYKRKLVAPRGYINSLWENHVIINFYLGVSFISSVMHCSPSQNKKSRNIFSLYPKKQSS